MAKLLIVNLCYALIGAALAVAVLAAFLVAGAGFFRAGDQIWFGED